jgi:hypothetical protein
MWLHGLRALKNDAEVIWDDRYFQCFGDRRTHNHASVKG